MDVKDLKFPVCKHQWAFRGLAWDRTESGAYNLVTLLVCPKCRMGSKQTVPLIDKDGNLDASKTVAVTVQNPPEIKDAADPK